MPDESLEEFLTLFIETARDRIRSLNEALLKLEKDPGDSALIDHIFQDSHSFKGESGMMAYKDLAYLMHVIEDVFFEIKGGRLKLDSKIATKIFSALDEASRSIDEIEKTKRELDLKKTIELLKKTARVNTLGGGQSQRATVSKTPAPVIPVPATEIETIKSVKVGTDSLDNMLNLTQELLVTKLRLDHLTKESRFNEVPEAAKSWGNLISDLQFQVMKARLIPLSFIFEHLPRLVRDLAETEHKQVELEVTGAEIGLDRTVIDHISEPFVHLIRNAIDHGIDKKGKIMISAAHVRGMVKIVVRDDGRGIDREKVLAKAVADKKITSEDARVITGAEIDKLIFAGVSTSPKVTMIAGRGVGMTAVKRIVESMGGSISVASEPGKFTEFTLTMPITLAIIKSLLTQVIGNAYLIPVLNVDRSITIKRENVKQVGGIDSFVLNGADVPLIYLGDLFLGGAEYAGNINQLTCVVVSVNGEQVGLVVDSIVGETEIILKPMPEWLSASKMFSGVTILGTGQAALVLDTLGIIDIARGA